MDDNYAGNILIFICFDKSFIVMLKLYCNNNILIQVCLFQAITNAQVPIVKMRDPQTGISCDICINNLLVVANTKLLRDYARIDDRLHQLAFIVKHWARLREVNKTYGGTLSSYA